MSKAPWAITYRPTSVKEFLFQSDAEKALVMKFIEDENIPHLLLAGHRGTGKSSLVNVLKHEIGITDDDYMYINASFENSVNVIRSKVSGFVNSYAMSPFKMVYLDEADRLSPEAQDALKSMMEDYADNARFVLTCNKPHKIIPELRSRCQEMTFKKLNKDDMFDAIINILKQEKIKIKEGYDTIIDTYIENTFPDFRKLINTVQQNVIDGKLVYNEVDTSDSGEFTSTIFDMMEAGKWSAIRGYMADNTPTEQWEAAYRHLYNYIDEVGVFAEDANKCDEAIITIADHLYKHNFVADAEINFAACIIKLSKIAKK